MSYNNNGAPGAPRNNPSVPAASTDAAMDILMGAEAPPLWNTAAWHQQQAPQQLQGVVPQQFPPGYFGYPHQQPAVSFTGNPAAYAPPRAGYVSGSLGLPWFSSAPAPPSVPLSLFGDDSFGNAARVPEGGGTEQHDRRQDSTRLLSRGRSPDRRYQSPEPDWRDLAIRQLQGDLDAARRELRRVRRQCEEQAELIATQHRRGMGNDPTPPSTRSPPHRSQRYQSPTPHRRPRSRIRSPPRWDRDRSPQLSRRRSPIPSRRRSASPVGRCAPPPRAGTAPTPTTKSLVAGPSTTKPRPTDRPAPVSSTPPLPYTNDPYADTNFLSEDGLSESDVDSDDARRRTKKHYDRAVRQRSRANAPAPPGSGAAVHVIPGEARLHGRFSHTPIVSVADASALITAAGTDDYALRYLDFLNTQLQPSTRNRTEGQHELVTRWNSFIAFNGERRDQARTAMGIPLSKKVKRPLPPAAAGSSTDKMETDEAPPAPPNSVDHLTWVASLRPNQRGFANTPASQWPAGVRQMVHGQAVEVPRNVGNIFLEPHEGDSVAASTTRRLAPLRINKDQGLNIHRQEFLRTWGGMFCTRGLFARIAQELRLTVGVRDLEHFPYDTRNVDVISIVRWVLDHNIGPASRTITALEDYAPLTIARQANLADFPQRTPDEWVASFGTQLNEASHTLRYPPLVSGATITTTSSEVQLLGHRPRVAPADNASAATAPVPSAVPVPSSSLPTGPGMPSADTGTVTLGTAPIESTDEDMAEAT